MRRLDIVVDGLYLHTVSLYRWLTDNCYRLTHEPDSATLRTENVDNTIAMAHDGQAFASAHLAKVDTHKHCMYCTELSIIV